MVRCSCLVIFYFKEKFCFTPVFCSRQQVTSLSRCLFLKRSEDLVEKIYLRLSLTQIVHSNDKMLFLKPNNYQSFYGALLTFSYFFYFKEKIISRYLS